MEFVCCHLINYFCTYVLIFFSSCRNLERAQSVLFENSSILEFGVKLDSSIEGIARIGSGGHGDHNSGKRLCYCFVFYSVLGYKSLQREFCYKSACNTDCEVAW